VQIPLDERANHVPRADYERAYALIEGEIRATGTVEEIFARLRANPDDHLVLDPKFIALLALVSQAGKALAAALLDVDELNRLQLALAREFSAVAEAFPTLLNRRDIANENGLS